MPGARNRTAVVSTGMLFGAGLSSAITSLAYCEEKTSTPEDESLPSLEDMTPEEQARYAQFLEDEKMVWLNKAEHPALL